MKRLVLLATLAACAHSATGDLRFQNREPVGRVAERPIAEPKPRVYNRTLYHTDGFFVRRTTRWMEMNPHVRARDVNALDEVPDSSWFENRLGVRDMSVDEIRRGPNAEPGPFAALPWTIIGAKQGGLGLGFTFTDANGDKYILKFDSANLPEAETAADIVVQRILWACGYNTPEDYVGYIHRFDLVIGDKAKKKGVTPERVDAVLKKVFRTQDGRIRVLASRFIAGKIVGPYAREGTRGDDPNDTIAHQERRSLRGQYAFFSWLNHADLQEDNTLDTYIDNHVVHYLVDFGIALGVSGTKNKWKTEGSTYLFDVGQSLSNLVGFGLRHRTYDGLKQPPLLGVGLFDAEHFDPGEWRSHSPYWPLVDKDAFDAFWASKILIRFTREQIAAIVDEAKYSDPRAAQYLVDTLVARQRKTARFWFDRVAPLDRFTYEPDGERARLCFTDLMLAYDLSASRTRYDVASFDRSGKTLGRQTVEAMPNGRRCVSGIAVAAKPDAYTIVRFDVHRNGSTHSLVVHLARDASATMRIIGLRRR
jgi:hypothetical protein